MKRWLDYRNQTNKPHVSKRKRVVKSSTRHRRTKQEIEHDETTDALSEKEVAGTVYLNTDIEERVAAHKQRSVWDL